MSAALHSLLSPHRCDTVRSILINSIQDVRKRKGVIHLTNNDCARGQLPPCEVSQRDIRRCPWASADVKLEQILSLVLCFKFKGSNVILMGMIS